MDASVIDRQARLVPADARVDDGDAVEYRTTAAGLRAQQLEGFFDGWPTPPSAAGLRTILDASDRCVVAIDPSIDRVVGFTTAITDGTLCAYISLLEVLPAYRSRGIGSELVRRLLADLEHLYMVDVSCDVELVAFYGRLGMQPAGGAALRRPQCLTDLTNATILE